MPNLLSLASVALIMAGYALAYVTGRCRSRRDVLTVFTFIEDPVEGPFAAVTWRAVTDAIVQAGGHPTGHVVFLDDALRVLSQRETIAYADGRSDQDDDLYPETETPDDSIH